MDQHNFPGEINYTFIFNEFVSSVALKFFMFPLEIVTRSTLIKNGSQ